jgi:hypothetical protein
MLHIWAYLFLRLLDVLTFGDYLELLAMLRLGLKLKRKAFKMLE